MSNLRGQWTVCKLTYSLWVLVGRGHYDGWRSWELHGWQLERRYKESTQETGQLNRMNQSSLGLLDFLGVPISPLLLSTDNSQFTIRVIVQRLFRKAKKRLTFAWNCFLKSPYLDILLSFKCSMISNLFLLPSSLTCSQIFWLSPLVDDLPIHLVPTSQIWK